MAPFERFVAKRYLLGARSRAEGSGFLRFIMFAAIGGVAVGVAALLIALAVVRGFSGEIEEKIMGFGAHIQVTGGYSDVPIQDASSMANRIAAFEGVGQVAPVIEDFALLRRTARQIDGVTVMGIRPIPAYVQENMIAGSANLDDGDMSQVLLGATLARRMNFEAGDTATLFSVASEAPADAELTLEGEVDRGLERPRLTQVRVAGIFDTSLTDFDDMYIIADVDLARELAGIGSDEVTRFDLRVTDTDQIGAIAQRIEEELGFPYQALTIYQVFSGLFAWVNLQQTITPLIIGVFIVVAAFNVIGTLLMLMMEKAGDIGILSSLGASQSALQRLFLSVGGLIGITGVVLGQLLALTLSLIQLRWEIIPLPAEAYYMTTAPIHLNPLDYLLVGVVALLLCLIAAYIPARVASRLDPVRTIRFK